MFITQLEKLSRQVLKTDLSAGFETLQTLTQQTLQNMNQGDLPRWQLAFNNLPDLVVDKVDLEAASVTVNGACTQQQRQQLKTSLEQLMPWRKGPFSLFDVNIDAEWRSDKKWQRLLKRLPDLNGKSVLDVGCGNGYYLLKMAAFQPTLLLGIEPGLLQNVQFWAAQKYANTCATMLPLKIQQIPKKFAYFDVVFSMGVLYHRKSPIEHLEHLRGLLRPQGELILETLIVPGDKQTCLVPQDRYAQMRNVWFLPSTDMLCGWLARIGMQQIEVINDSLTSTAEQRSTDWMRFHSLPQFLKQDEQQTIEGYSPPRRVLIRCKK